MSKPNWIDRALAPLAPRMALRRIKARTAFEAVRAYDGASTGRRVENWTPKNASADAEIAIAGPRLRARMRDLVRNNRYAAQAVRALVSNTVGPGIMPRANTGRDALDRRVTELFQAWQHECHSAGALNFYGLQALAVREMFEAGEVLGRRRPRRSTDRLSVPLQVEMIEADLLDSLKTGDLQNGGRIVQGVEFDRVGRRVAYWLYRDHPGGNALSLRGGFESRRVPASDVVHLFETLRTQARGVPRGAAAMRGVYDLDAYQDAELTRKRIEASVAGFVVADDEDDQLAGGPTVQDVQGNEIETFEPGIIAILRGTKDIRFNDPSTTGGYREFTDVNLHGIAAGFGVPYALMTGDLSKVNFSSSRLGLLEFRREMDALQAQVIIPAFCMPIWRWFIEAAFTAGLIPTADVGVKWVPPRREPIDPLKDAQADQIAMRTMSKHLGQVLAENGVDMEAHLEEVAEINALMDRLGIASDADPRRDAAAPVEMEDGEDDDETSED